MSLLLAFIVGGLICGIGQLIIDSTPAKITTAHILVAYVTIGAVLSGLGLYQPLVDFAGAGATIPVSGFGHSLVQGAIEAVKSNGLMGALSGGLQATALGITLAVVFGYITAVIFRPIG